MPKMGIQRQTLLLILLCSFATLVTVGGVFLYGMNSIRISSENIGKDIGEAAIASSSEALKRDKQDDLRRLLMGSSAEIESVFDNLAMGVNMLANEMTTILQNPENYAGRRVEEPSAANAGRLAPQLQFATEGARYDQSLRRDINLAANIQDWLMRMRQDNELVAGAYITSKLGFSITVDDRSEKKIDQATGLPFLAEHRTRPWYQKAVAEKKAVFTDIYEDRYGDGLAITCAAPYYGLDGEIAGVVGEGMVLKRVNSIVLNTKLGETGFGFVIDKAGRVIFSPKDSGSLRQSDDGKQSLFAAEEPIAQVARQMAAGETGLTEIVIDGAPCYLAYTPLKAMGCSYGIVIEVAEATQGIQEDVQVIAKSTDTFLGTLDDSIRSTLLAMLIITLVILAVIPFISSRVAKSFVHPIHLLSAGVREIAGGNLDKKLDIKTGNEIEHLAVCFNAMTDELKTQMANLTKVTADKERIATELSVATSIQESMLPREFPPFPGRQDFDIYASMRAAKEVGGDFYDFYLLDENHLMITIADVSGKGVPAALFMVIAKTILKNFALTMGGADDIAPLVACTNDQLCQSNDAMMFVTAFVGMLELDTGRFAYVNAGHNPPLLYRKNEARFSYLQVKRNFVLGGMDELTFKGQELWLAPGDRLFLYTDGVTEALNEAKELYGEERLQTALNEAGAENLTLRELVERVQNSLAAHVKTAEQSDDITMLALVYNGKGTDPKEA